MTVTTRVRGQLDKPTLNTHTVGCVSAPYMFLAQQGLERAVGKLLRAAVTLNSTIAREIDVGTAKTGNNPTCSS